MEKIYITESYDPVFDTSWYSTVLANQPTILITKDVKKLFEDFEKSTGKSLTDFNLIVHSTITGLGGSRWEPSVPDPQIELDFIKKLPENFRNDRLVLRIDPIIIEKVCLAKSFSIVEKSKGYIKRIRISFLDLYSHVRQRLPLDLLNKLIDFYDNEIHANLETRKKLLEIFEDKFGHSIEVCGEPGMPCSGCVSEVDCQILNIVPDKENKRQRKFCSCLANKIELLSERHPCPHQCLYCYWKNKN